MSRWYCCIFVLGVLLAQHASFLISVNNQIIGFFVLGSAYFILRKVNQKHNLHKSKVILLTLLSIYSGAVYVAWRAEYRLQTVLPASLENKLIWIEGHISGLPKLNSVFWQFDFKVHQRLQEGQLLPETIYLSWYDHLKEPLQAGDIWRFPVRLKQAVSTANFSVKNTETYWFAQNIRAVGSVRSHPKIKYLGQHHDAMSFIHQQRAALTKKIQNILQDRFAISPYMGMLIALAVGDQQFITDEQWQLLRKTGTNHLMAISGLHIGIAAAIGWFLGGIVWKIIAYCGGRFLINFPLIVCQRYASLFPAAAYVLISGGNIPAQRALLMLILVVIASHSGRFLSTLTVWCWVLVALVLWDPWSVVYAGFWLSFLAVACIILAISRQGYLIEKDASKTYIQNTKKNTLALTKWPFIERIKQSFKYALIMQWRVQYVISLTMIPLSILFFSSVSLISPIANVLSISWVSIVVVPLLFLWMCLPSFIGNECLQLSYGALSGLMQLLEKLAALPMSAITVYLPSFSLFGLLILAILLLVFPVGWPLKRYAVCLFLPMLSSHLSAPTQDQRLTIEVLDVGQGSAVLIYTSRQMMLFDAGPKATGRRVVVPTIAQRLSVQHRLALETLVISHGDADHAGGVPAILEAIPVKQIVGGLQENEPITQQIKQNGLNFIPCVAGQIWQWGEITFKMLWPDQGPEYHYSRNRRSCVLKIEAFGWSILLTGDIDRQAEAWLVKNKAAELPADILLAPHHGSQSSSSNDFIYAVHPKVVIFQTGYCNSFRHPHSLIVRRYQLLQAISLNTSQDGAIRMIFSPKESSIVSYRNYRAPYWFQANDLSRCLGA